MTLPATERRGQKPSSLRYYQDGPPYQVDLNSWALEISGLDVPPGSFTYPELTQLPRVQESRRYVCVCNWSMREAWSGFLLADFLAMSGWSGSAEGRFLRQTSIGTKEKGVYESTIPLGAAIRRRALLIDRIDGEPLPIERGFPLRLLDFGLYGYKSVKGLHRLEITAEFELGEWERKAGYSLTGEIQPKRYRLCDHNRHLFIEQPGEVTDV
jgi:DMSO/TMAO reductase YedYZ molybdopterin-dependent catalytic subunit